jgi:hypothetical protein
MKKLMFHLPFLAFLVFVSLPTRSFAYDSSCLQNSRDKYTQGIQNCEGVEHYVDCCNRVIAIHDAENAQCLSEYEGEINQSLNAQRQQKGQQCSRSSPCADGLQCVSGTPWNGYASYCK